MNYQNLQTTIANRLNRKDLTSQIQTWIYNARRNIAEGILPIVAKGEQAYHRFSWTFEPSTLQTVKGVDLVDYPTNYIDEADMFMESENKPVLKLTINQMNDSFYANNNSTSTGNPTNYSPFATSFKLYPIPAGVYDITLYHYAYPETLVNDSDEFTIDKKCPDLIVEFCCFEGAVFLKNKDDQATFGETAKNRYFNLMVADRRLKLTNSGLRMTTWRDQPLEEYKGRNFL